MLTSLLHNGQLRSLLAGFAYTLLCALGSHAAHALARRLERSSTPGVVRIRRWRGWSPLARAVRLIVAIGFAFSMLLVGVFASSDVGVSHIHWGSTLPRVVGVTGGATAWIALLWWMHWRKRPEAEKAGVRGGDSWAGVLTDLLSNTADAAIYRAALIPLLGSYWGVWLAIAWTMLASLTRAGLKPRLATAGRRERVFLEWALDWVDATLYILSGTVSAALFGRAVCLLVVLGVVQRTRKGRERKKPSGSANQQSQGHQNGKHGRGQDGKTLQIT